MSKETNRRLETVVREHGLGEFQRAFIRVATGDSTIDELWRLATAKALELGDYPGFPSNSKHFLPHRYRDQAKDRLAFLQETAGFTGAQYTSTTA